MSEFSTLVTRYVTPLLRQWGFKKHGAFGRGALYDVADYRRGDLEVQLIFSLHPYDYPLIGIRLEMRDANGLLFDRFYPPVEGGIKAMLEAATSDIKETVDAI